MIDTVSRLFGNGRLRTCAQFHHTTLPVPVWWMPDPDVSEGARVCLEAQTRGGNLTFPRPITMEGLSAFFGLIRPNEIRTTPAGRVEVTTGCFGIDAPARLGDFLRPVPLRDFLKKFLEGGTPPDEILSNLMRALHLVGLEGRVCRDQDCRDTAASLALYLDIPEVLETIQSQRYLNLDFSGILEGSSLDWNGFPLSLLPLPEGLRIPDGTADIHVSYHPASKTTDITLGNLNARLYVDGLWEQDPIEVSGNITMTVGEGGRAKVHLEGLSLRIPSFPSDQIPALSVDFTVSGDVTIHLEPDKRLSIDELRLSVTDLDLETPAGRGILFPNGLALGGDLYGSATVDYPSNNPEELLRLGLDLQGEAVVETGGGGTISLNQLLLQGDSGFQFIDRRWRPNVGDSRWSVSGDLDWGEGATPALSMNGFRITLTGTGSNELDGLHQEAATLKAGADSLQVGLLSFSPALSLNLISTEDRRDFWIDGQGQCGVRSRVPFVDVGSAITLFIDLAEIDWKAQVNRDLFFGPATARGSMDLSGSIPIPGTGNLSRWASWRITTTRPFDVSLEGARNPIVQGLAVSARAHRGWVDGSIGIASLADLLQATLHLQGPTSGEGWNGNYLIQGRQHLPVTPELALNGTSAEGQIDLPPLFELIGSPRVPVSGNASTQLSGAANGPVSTTYHGTARYDSGSFSFTFDGDQPSTLSFGPLAAEGGEVAEGQATAIGTILLTPEQGGLRVAGNHLGIRNGQVFIAFNGDFPRDAQGHRVPALHHLSMVADRLREIRNGVAIAGGDGFQFETFANPVGLGVGVFQEETERHVRFTTDRLPLSTEGYWQMFRRMLRGGL